MKVVVQAAGALGLLVGWFLHDKNEVVCVSREHIAELVSKDGLEVKFSGENKRKMINIVNSADMVEFEPDLVVLACKSFNTDENLSIIKNHWPKTNIMTIQNGVYTEYKAFKMFDKSQIFPASVLIGSKFIGRNRLEQFFDYGMRLGSLGNDSFLKVLLKIFIDSGVKVEKSQNIMKDKWHKFMFYCSSATINALTATLDLSFEHTRWMVERSLDEIVEVGKFLDLGFDCHALADEVLEFSLNFKPKVWNASVGVDLRKGKRTEIDYLNGYVVQLGKEYGVDVPVNETLYRLVKTLEQTRLFSDFV